MSKKQNSKLPQRVSITALDRTGVLVKTDLTVEEFLDYMAALTERDCLEINIFTVQFFMKPTEAINYVRPQTQLRLDSLIPQV